MRTNMMIRNCLIHSIFIFYFNIYSFCDDANFPIHESLIPLASKMGIELLDTCPNKYDYIQLSMYFECQENLTFCGPASISTVLNSLHIPRPESSRHQGYKLFDQHNIFSLGDSPPKSIQDIRRNGMTLDELASHFECASVQVDCIFATESSENHFRRSLMKSTGSSSMFVVVNYLRSTIHQKGNGHISPIAAYHAESDSALLLDVSKYKYPPVWVKVPALYNAMSTIDGKTSRGYVIVFTPPIKD